MGLFCNNKVYSSTVPMSPIMKEMMKDEKIKKEVFDRIFNNSDKPILFNGKEYIIGRASK